MPTSLRFPAYTRGKRETISAYAISKFTISNFTFGSFTVAHADTTTGIAVKFVSLSPAGANVSLTALTGAMI